MTKLAVIFTIIFDSDKNKTYKYKITLPYRNQLHMILLHLDFQLHITLKHSETEI